VLFGLAAFFAHRFIEERRQSLTENESGSVDYQFDRATVRGK
jgi:hypothetical protein